MSFENLQFVWLVWLLPIFILFFLFAMKKKRTVLFQFIQPNELKKKLPEFSLLKPWLKLFLFIIALIFFILALMKPYSGYELREVNRKGIDIFFLVDVSQSMLAEDIKPNRLTRAKHEIKDFLAVLTGDRVGLIGFAGEAFTLVPLTSDYPSFQLFLEELQPDLIPVPGTDIQGAIQKAVESFKKQAQSSSKAIILITDGEDSIGLNQSLIQDIQKYDVKIYVIGIGTPEGAPIPLVEGGYKKDRHHQVVVTKLNEAELQKLAVATGGGYVRSVSGDLDLDQIYYQGIKKAFTEEDLAVSQKKLPHYRFQPFILLGLVLLILETFFSERKSRFMRFIKR